MMKESKDKEVMDKVVKQGVQSQSRPPAGEKRKNISSRVDLGDLPSRRGREKKTQVVQASRRPIHSSRP